MTKAAKLRFDNVIVTFLIRQFEKVMHVEQLAFPEQLKLGGGVQMLLHSSLGGGGSSC